MEKYSVGLMPSLSLTETSYKDIREMSVFPMGTSDFSDSPGEEVNLPAGKIELKAISELWPGGSNDPLQDKDFTIENLRDKRKSFGIVHLTTHANFQSNEPENTYIQFWGNSTLSLDKVRELGLNNPPTLVELMVLSACRTAVGDRKAELGFAGFSAKAGSKSTLASLWYVGSEGTLGLMTDFYTQLKEEGVIKAEALRQSQLDMINGDIRIKDDKLELVKEKKSWDLPDELTGFPERDFTHPYYWSGFTIIGNPW